jgi:hypothetical protein
MAKLTIIYDAFLLKLCREDDYVVSPKHVNLLVHRSQRCILESTGDVNFGGTQAKGTKDKLPTILFGPITEEITLF